MVETKKKKTKVKESKNIIKQNKKLAANIVVIYVVTSQVAIKMSKYLENHIFVAGCSLLLDVVCYFVCFVYLFIFCSVSVRVRVFIWFRGRMVYTLLFFFSFSSFISFYFSSSAKS